QPWFWDRPMDHSDLGRFPTPAWTRVLKFPSREMPDRLLTSAEAKLRFGKRFDDSGGTTPAIVDELVFPKIEFPEAVDRRKWTYLGPVPPIVYAAGGAASSGTTSTVAPLVQYVGIDEKAETFRVFHP